MDKDTDEIKRVTLNLPRGLLKEALAYTGQNLTETIIQGLEHLKRARAFGQAMRLKGKLNLNINLETSRERSR